MLAVLLGLGGLALAAATARRKTVRLLAGRWYRWTLRFDVPSGESLDLEYYKGSIEQAGARDILITTGPCDPKAFPFCGASYFVMYTQRCIADHSVKVGESYSFQLRGVRILLTVLEVKPFNPPKDDDGFWK